MNQYANKVFSAGMQITTVGTDSVLKQLSVEGRQCWMMIVDSAGQERFQSSLGAQFYRGADACVLTFDVYTHTHTHTHTHTQAGMPATGHSMGAMIRAVMVWLLPRPSFARRRCVVEPHWVEVGCRGLCRWKQMVAPNPRQVQHPGQQATNHF
jgi:GTPase SAR1 family protein